MQTTVRHKAELEGDSPRHIQPVQFVMKESRQTTIKFLRVVDYSSGGVEINRFPYETKKFFKTETKLKRKLCSKNKMETETKNKR